MTRRTFGPTTRWLRPGLVLVTVVALLTALIATGSTNVLGSRAPSTKQAAAAPKPAPPAVKNPAAKAVKPAPSKSPAARSNSKAPTSIHETITGGHTGAPSRTPGAAAASASQPVPIPIGHPGAITSVSNVDAGPAIRPAITATPDPYLAKNDTVTAITLRVLTGDAPHQVALPPNAHLPYGVPVTLQATVSEPSTKTPVQFGAVTFTEAGGSERPGAPAIPLCTNVTVVDGGATCAITALAAVPARAAAYRFGASFAHSGRTLAASSVAPADEPGVLVSPAKTTMSVAAVPDGAGHLRLTAKVVNTAPGHSMSPGGTVAFTNGGVALSCAEPTSALMTGSDASSTASCVIPEPGGKATFKALYRPSDGNFIPSHGSTKFSPDHAAARSRRASTSLSDRALLTGTTTCSSAYAALWGASGTLTFSPAGTLGSSGSISIHIPTAKTGTCSPTTAISFDTGTISLFGSSTVGIGTGNALTAPKSSTDTKDTGTILDGTSGALPQLCFTGGTIHEATVATGDGTLSTTNDICFSVNGASSTSGTVNAITQSSAITVSGGSDSLSTYFTVAPTSVQYGTGSAPADCSIATNNDAWLQVGANVTLSLGSWSGTQAVSECKDLSSSTTALVLQTAIGTYSADSGAVTFTPTVTVTVNSSGKTITITGSMTANMNGGGTFTTAVTVTAGKGSDGKEFVLGADDADLSNWLGTYGDNAEFYYASADISGFVTGISAIGTIDLVQGVNIITNIGLSTAAYTALSNAGMSVPSGTVQAIATFTPTANVPSTLTFTLGAPNSYSNTTLVNTGGTSLTINSASLQATVTKSTIAFAVSMSVTLSLPQDSAGDPASSVVLAGSISIGNTNNVPSASISVSVGDCHDSTVTGWNNAFGIPGLNVECASLGLSVSKNTTDNTTSVSGNFSGTVTSLPSVLATLVGYQTGAPISFLFNLDPYVLDLSIGTKNSSTVALEPLAEFGAPTFLEVNYADLYESPQGATVNNVVYPAGYSLAFQGSVQGININVLATEGINPPSINFTGSVSKISLGGLSVGPVTLTIAASTSPKSFEFQFQGSENFSGSLTIPNLLQVSGSLNATVTVSASTSGSSAGFSAFVSGSVSGSASVYNPFDSCSGVWYDPVTWSCTGGWDSLGSASFTLAQTGIDVNSSGITLSIDGHSITIPFGGGATTASQSFATSTSFSDGTEAGYSVVHQLSRKAVFGNTVNLTFHVDDTASGQKESDLSGAAVTVKLQNTDENFDKTLDPPNKIDSNGNVTIPLTVENCSTSCSGGSLAPGWTSVTLCLVQTTNANGIIQSSCDTEGFDGVSAVVPDGAGAPTGPDPVSSGSSTTYTSDPNVVSLPAASIYWYSSTDNGSTWNAIAGATGTTYTFTPTHAQDKEQLKNEYVISGGGTISSNAATLDVAQAPVTPTTTVSVSPATATYGSENTTISITVTGPAGDGAPQGSVYITRTNAPGCLTSTSFTLSATTANSSTWTCSITGTVLSPGSYDIETANYAPTVNHSSSNNDIRYLSSSSTGTATWTVAAESLGTTTAFQQSSLTGEYGQAIGNVTVVVTGAPGDGYPIGSVALSGAAGLCTPVANAQDDLSTSDSTTYVCGITANSVDSGAYTVSAAFTPSTGVNGSSSNSNFTYSASSSATGLALTVTAQGGNHTTSELSVTNQHVTYGSETTTFTVVVSGDVSATPKGTVSLTGAPGLCQPTQTSTTANTATYSCSVGNSDIPVGTYTDVAATWTPGSPSSSNANYVYQFSSASYSATLEVDPIRVDPKSTTLSVTPLNAIQGTAMTTTVVVTGPTGDGAPLGSVSLTGGTNMCMFNTPPTISGDSATYTCIQPAGSPYDMASGSDDIVASWQPNAGTDSSNPNYQYDINTTSNKVHVNVTTPVPVAMTLTASPSPTPFGSESTTFTVTVAPSVDHCDEGCSGIPQGTVSLSGAPGLCTPARTSTDSTAQSATYTCSLSGSAVPGGSQTVTATYLPPASSSPSSSNQMFSFPTTTSSPVTFVVTPTAEATTTSVTSVSPSTTPYGTESTTFTAVVTGISGDGTPQGSVTLAGAPGLCPLGLLSTTAYTATYSCTIAGTAVEGGAYTISATYAPATTSSSNPDFAYTGSTSTSSGPTFTVSAGLPTAPSIAVSTLPATTSYAAENATINVIVTGDPLHGYPQGTATLGGVSGLCHPTFSSESGATAVYSCAITGNALAAGSYTITAAYTPSATSSSSSPDYSYSGVSTASGTSLIVNPGVEQLQSITTSIAPTSTTYGSESVGFTVTLKGQPGAGIPEGNVGLDGTSGLCAPTLSSTASAPTGDTATFACSVSGSAVPAGSPAITATFTPSIPSSSNANWAYAAATSSGQSVTVLPEAEPTTVALSATGNPATYGSENSTFTATVTGVAGDGIPQGTVTLQPGFCLPAVASTTTSSATYSCSISGSAAPANPGYILSATFHPAPTLSSSDANFAYQGAASATQSYVVNAAGGGTTTTTFTLSTNTVTFKSSSPTATLTAVVAGIAGEGTPQGTMAFAGVPGVCQPGNAASTTATTATFSCTTSGAQLFAAGAYTAAGSYTVTASWTPLASSSSNPNFTYTSSSSVGQTFTVNPAPESAVTSVNFANTRTPNVNYGSEDFGFRVDVDGFGPPDPSTNSSNTPLGTVTLNGAPGGCTPTLSSTTSFSQTYLCSLSSGTAMAAGSYSVTATFTPAAPSSTDPNVVYTGGTSAPFTFTVNPEQLVPGATTLSFTSPVTYGSENTAFTVNVAGQPGDGYPTGTVTFTNAPAGMCTPAFMYAVDDVATWGCSISGSAIAVGDTPFLTARMTTPHQVPSSNPNIVYLSLPYSNSSDFTVNPAPATTTTALTVSPTTYTWGDTEPTVTVTVTGQPGDGYPIPSYPNGITFAGVDNWAGSPFSCLPHLVSNTDDSATYQCLRQALLGGSYPMTAVFSGGSSNPNFTYISSTSNSVAMNISPEPVRGLVSLSESGPATYGSEGLTFTAAVTQDGIGTPEGTVTLTGAPGLCTPTLTSTADATATYVCTTSATALDVGSYSIGATFTPGSPSSSLADYQVQPGSSSPVGVTISPAQDSLGASNLTVTPETTYGSEDAIVTVNVTGQANEGYPVGTVALSGPAGLCTPVLTSTAADTATYTCSISGTALAAGSVTVGATFTPGTPSSSNPDFVYTGTSTTNSAALTVDPEAEPTTTALAISGPAPTYGSENLTATATVTGVAGDGAPAGTVTLSGQQCALAVSSTTSDAATYTCAITGTAMSGGPATITATFHPASSSSSNGNFSYTTSASNSVAVTVAPETEASTTTVSVLPATTTYGFGDAVITAVVTGQHFDGDPVGTLTVAPSAAVCGSPTDGADDTTTYTCTIPKTLAAGSYPVTATFIPATPNASTSLSFTYTGSTGTASPGLTIKPAATTTTVTSSPDTSTYGQPVTLTATVAPTDPIAFDGGGTVAFTVGGAPIATCGSAPIALTGGTYQATCTTGSLPGGTDSIVATYSGDNNFITSASTAITHKVIAAPTTLRAAPAIVSISPLKLYLFTLTATLTSGETHKGAPGQKVAFKAGSTAICTGTTDASGVATCSGVASIAQIVLAQGYTASFAATPDYLASSAAAGLLTL